MLAYEHTIWITLDAGKILPRLTNVQNACTEQRFGECVVLDLDQQAGDSSRTSLRLRDGPSASLTLRAAPEAVDPLIALAGDGGTLDHRNTHAEDLSMQVHDNQQDVQRLKNELAQLQVFQQRSDLAVADMIALAERLADVQSRLEAAEQTGAQHQRRIATQKLRVNFSALTGKRARSEVITALYDVGDTLSSGAAWTIWAVAFLLPLGVVALGIVGLWRWLRRRRAARQPSLGKS